MPRGTPIISEVTIECPHKDRPIQARGLCGSCYGKWLKLVKPDYAERQREKHRRWVEQYPEKMKAAQERLKTNGKRVKIQRRCDLKRAYRLTEPVFNAMLAEQGGVCKICGRPETCKGKNHLSIDHCHTTGDVRGLLCNQCNRGIGWFRDNPQQLRAAAEYLESHNADRSIEPLEA
jgi:hypothetical protein